MTESDNKIKVAAVALTITRDAMTVLPAVVPAHEVDIVKAVFGDDNVLVHDTAQEPRELDPATEAERLVAKYGPDALEKTHGKNFAGAVARACKDAEVKAPKKAEK